MPIIYALVSRGIDVLCDATSPDVTGNFSNITRVLLNRIPVHDNSRCSYRYDQYVFHYQTIDTLISLCMTDRDYSRKLAFDFLTELDKEFNSTYGNLWKKAAPYTYQTTFSPSLLSLMDTYSSSDLLSMTHANTDHTIQAIHNEVAIVKDNMIKNIDKLLQRGEKLELLVQKVDSMEQNAVRFSSQSKKLKNNERKRNIKIALVLFIFILTIIYVILTLACGGVKIPKCLP